MELAGGVRSPQADDGDAVDFVAELRPEVVVLVADAGLGTINAARLSMAALATVTDGPEPIPVVLVLDRFDDRRDIHRRNRQWLAERDGYRVDGPSRRGVGSGRRVARSGREVGQRPAVTEPPAGPNPEASTTARLNGRPRVRSSAQASSPSTS